MNSVDRLLSKVNKDALLRSVASVAGERRCQLHSDKPLTGNGYMIFLIELPEQERIWAARFPLDQNFPFAPLIVEPLLYAARNFPQIPIPKLHDYRDIGSETDVRAGYLLLDYMNGTPLRPWTYEAPAFAVKQAIIDQLSNHMLAMISKPAGKDITHYGIDPQIAVFRI